MRRPSRRDETAPDKALWRRFVIVGFKLALLAAGTFAPVPERASARAPPVMPSCASVSSNGAVNGNIAAFAALYAGGERISGVEAHVQGVSTVVFELWTGPRERSI